MSLLYILAMSSIWKDFFLGRVDQAYPGKEGITTWKAGEEASEGLVRGLTIL